MGKKLNLFCYTVNVVNDFVTPDIRKGTVKALSPMNALEKVVKKYGDLHEAVISESILKNQISQEGEKVLARYFSVEAATKVYGKEFNKEVYQTEEEINKMSYKKLKNLSPEELDRINPLSKKEIEIAFNSENIKTTKKFKKLSEEYVTFLDGDKN